MRFHIVKSSSDEYTRLCTIDVRYVRLSIIDLDPEQFTPEA